MVGLDLEKIPAKKIRREVGYILIGSSWFVVMPSGIKALKIRTPLNLLNIVDTCKRDA